MTDVSQTIAARHKTHGEYTKHAETAQALKRTVFGCKARDAMPAFAAQSLEMICDKVARLVNGQIDHVDSWHDIAGYAKLAEDRFAPKIATFGALASVRVPQTADELHEKIKAAIAEAGKAAQEKKEKELRESLKTVEDYARPSVELGKDHPGVKSHSQAFAADVLRRTHEAHGSPEASKAWATANGNQAVGDGLNYDYKPETREDAASWVKSLEERMKQLRTIPFSSLVEDEIVLISGGIANTRLDFDLYNGPDDTTRNWDERRRLDLLRHQVAKGKVKIDKDAYPTDDPRATLALTTEEWIERDRARVLEIAQKKAAQEAEDERIAKEAREREIRKATGEYAKPDVCKAIGIDLATGKDQTAIAFMRDGKVERFVGDAQLIDALHSGAKALREKAQAKRDEADAIEIDEVTVERKPDNLMDLQREHMRERQELWQRQRDEEYALRAKDVASAN